MPPSSDVPEPQSGPSALLILVILVAWIGLIQLMYALVPPRRQIAPPAPPIRQPAPAAPREPVPPACPDGRCPNQRPSCPRQPCQKPCRPGDRDDPSRPDFGPYPEAPRGSA